MSTLPKSLRDETIRFGPAHTPELITGRTISFTPLNPQSLNAWQSDLTKEQAEAAYEARLELQRQTMPKFIGEFVTNITGGVGFALNRQQILAVGAHWGALFMRAFPRLGDFVYGGYDGRQFRKYGTLFGEKSTQAALEVQTANQFHATQWKEWRSMGSLDHDNPLIRMYDGKVRGWSPIIAGFALDQLVQVEPERDPTLWQPKEGLTIADTLRVVYHAR